MPEQSDTKDRPADKGKIVLIEDDLSVLSIIKRLLERKGYEVADFDNPRGAIEKLAGADGRFDLMVIDINLPEMDGFDASTRLKGFSALSDVPIIFISAIHTSSEEMNRGLSLGAVDYIIKPFDPEIFLSKVDNFVALKRNEERVRALKMRYQLLFEKYNDPTVILDLTGYVLEVNDAAKKILGMGGADSEVEKTSFLDLVHGEDKREALKLIDSLTGLGRPQAPRVVRVIDRSGDYRFMEINGGAFFNREGAKSTPDSIHITLRDITERVMLTRNLGLLFDTSRRLSGALALGEIFSILTESIEKAVYASRIGVVYLTPDGNAALMATTGPVSKKMRGKIELPHLIDLTDYPEYRAAIETRKTVMIEEVDGDPVVAGVRDTLNEIGIESILVIPIVMEDVVYGLINLAEIGGKRRFTSDEIEVLESTADLTALSVENALMFDKIKKNEEFKTHLINVFTHEVGTPLGTIIGHTQILMEGLDQEDRRLKNLKAIYGETNRLNSLMEGFLDITRLRSGKLTPKIEKINPGVIAAKLYREFEERFREKGIDPSLEIEEKGLSLDGDLLLIEGAVTNLLSNGLKYTPSGGRITLTLKSYDGGLTIARADKGRRAKAPLVSFSVKDTGIGVPVGDREKIFEEFYRSANVPGDEKGAGLGLTFVKEVAEIHGGAVRLIDNSDTEGGGSTFEMILPGRK
ncbi:MAG: response regulator [Deltaproteobacteria bacterium]|uniref:histidine kinase n=1 Tax=Candidatus Zymogenus saltonus TaxID=2844893 RepID=A0A9D8KJE4_9DELT|nr:response regulator [Candidatus Zymogenus saltonus]